MMYRTNFLMFHKYHYDITWFENMIPFEREIYINMLINKIETDNAKNAAK